MGKSAVLALVMSLLFGACTSTPKKPWELKGKTSKVEFFKPLNTVGEVGLNCMALEASEEDLEKYSETAPELLVQYAIQIKFPMKVGEGKMGYCERFQKRFRLAEGHHFKRVKITRFL